MGLKKLAEKVADYNERLERGAVNKIKPSHVRKVLEKLNRKAAELEEDIASAESEEKKARLAVKRDVARQHIERAEWLLKEIE